MTSTITINDMRFTCRDCGTYWLASEYEDDNYDYDLCTGSHCPDCFGRQISTNQNPY